VVSATNRRGRVKLRITSFDEFRDAVSAYRLPRILLTALELDLFTKIGTRRWTIPQLAKAVSMSERGLSILCRNLAMSGLLTKTGQVYRNSRLAATALNARDAAYRKNYLDLMTSHWQDWARLGESVRTGRPLDEDEPEEPGYRQRFTWAMHYRTLETAPKIAAQVDLHGATTLLDLGGGPGTYAMAFLSKHPRLCAAVGDRPEALEVAREIAATHRAGARLSYVPVDFTKEAIPGSYDVIWYSNVLHIYSPATNRAIFRRALAALNPGGRLLIQDAFLHDREGLHPAEASLFACSMLLFTEEGNTYSARETSVWLKKAGFATTKVLRMKPGAEDWEDGILEAVAPGGLSRKRLKKPVQQGRSK